MYNNFIILAWLIVAALLVQWFIKFNKTKKEIEQMSDDRYMNELISMAKKYAQSIK